MSTNGGKPTPTNVKVINQNDDAHSSTESVGSSNSIVDTAHTPPAQAQITGQRLFTGQSSLGLKSLLTNPLYDPRFLAKGDLVDPFLRMLKRNPNFLDYPKFPKPPKSPTAPRKAPSAPTTAPSAPKCECDEKSYLMDPLWTILLLLLFSFMFFIYGII